MHSNKVETSPSGHKALATPAVRHLSKKHSIDINTVHGTGKDGRVTKEDILSFMSGGAQKQVKPVSEHKQAPVGRQVQKSNVLIKINEGDE